MPVDLQSYRPWEGRARPTFTVVGAIAGTMIRRVMRLKLVRWIVTFVLIMSLIIPGVIYAVLLQGKGNPMFTQVAEAIGVNNINLLAYANRGFHNSAIGFWSTLIAALVASPLIAEDRRVGALALYFSRPIGHVHYVLGKLAALAFYVGALLFLPPLLMFLMDLAMSESDPRWGTFARSLVPCAAGLITICSVSLGVSSLHRRAHYAALMTLGLLFGVFVISNLLAREILDDPKWLALYPFFATERLAIEFMPVPDRLDPSGPVVRGIPLGWAWTSLAAWTAAGIGVLVARIRNVEVVG